MLIFNNLLKLNYWDGKDSLKDKPYLEDANRQKPGPKRKMRLIDEYLMVFMRLRLGLLEQDLVERFRVSVSTVSRVLITWYNVLAVHLKELIVWPSKEIIAANMPQCFQKFPNTRIILDCTEFYIEILVGKPVFNLFQLQVSQHFQWHSCLGFGEEMCLTINRL